MENYHTPVLLNESIEGLNINPSGIYVDVTFGGGGHSREIFSRLTTGKLIAFDQDKDALQNVIHNDRFIFVNHNFRFLKNFLRYNGFEKVDGIIADLGVSSHHFDVAQRGFSFRFDAELDMRMSEGQELTAFYVINNYSEKELYRIINSYAEIKNAGALVRTILMEREKQPVVTTAQFAEIVKRNAPKNRENKYLAQIFQAVRMEVNQEVEALSIFLQQTTSVLKNNARLVVLTYHSIEDRLVKNFFKTGNLEGEVVKDFYGNVLTPFELIAKKPIVASEEENESNSRARSAKLRIAEFKNLDE